MDVICYLSNLPLHGIANTDYPDGRSRINKIQFSAFGYDLNITQDMSIIKDKWNNLKGKFLNTSEISIRDVISKDHLEESMTILAEMLSFATNSQVGFIGWESINSESLDGSRGHIKNIGGCFSARNPPFCLIRSMQAAHFINQCWQRYSDLRQSRKLNIVTHLFTIPDANNLPLEIKLATTFILIENLKSSYAHSVYPYKNGAFREVGNINSKAIGYDRLVREMFEAVNMDGSETWKNLRNDIVHTGICELSAEGMYQKYEQCRDALTEYILRLLGYHGQFYLYTGRGDISKTIE